MTINKAQDEKKIETERINYMNDKSNDTVMQSFKCSETVMQSFKCSETVMQPFKFNENKHNTNLPLKKLTSNVAQSCIHSACCSKNLCFTDSTISDIFQAIPLFSEESDTTSQIFHDCNSLNCETLLNYERNLSHTTFQLTSYTPRQKGDYKVRFIGSRNKESISDDKRGNDKNQERIEENCWHTQKFWKDKEVAHHEIDNFYIPHAECNSNTDSATDQLQTSKTSVSCLDQTDKTQLCVEVNENHSHIKQSQQKFNTPKSILKKTYKVPDSCQEPSLTQEFFVPQLQKNWLRTIRLLEQNLEQEEWLTQFKQAQKQKQCKAREQQRKQKQQQLMLQSQTYNKQQQSIQEHNKQQLCRQVYNKQLCKQAYSKQQFCIQNNCELTRKIEQRQYLTSTAHNNQGRSETRRTPNYLSSKENRMNMEQRPETKMISCKANNHAHNTRNGLLSAKMQMNRSTNKMRSAIK